KEIEILFEKSGQLAQISLNQLIISSVAKIKTDLYSLPQLAAIDIKFSPENSYLAQQQFVDFHEQTQVINDSKREPEQDQNMLENPGSVTIVEAQSETNSNTNRATLANNYLFDIDLQQFRAQAETSQNEALNLKHLNEDNGDSISKPVEYTKSKIEKKKED
ncbi:598_t:CDS:2, partial [Gigaspora margarita]